MAYLALSHQSYYISSILIASSIHSHHGARFDRNERMLSKAIQSEYSRIELDSHTGIN